MGHSEVRAVSLQTEGAAGAKALRWLCSGEQQSLQLQGRSRGRCSGEEGQRLRAVERAMAWGVWTDEWMIWLLC